ncbi:MAG: ATP-grasp domain-containing protein [Chloroflexi bacterium]|nr:ATP-grasp domain-containing protein [Chloroflexota bacterium]
MFDKVLIANRGEIACRIIKTCRKLGISTVAVYAKAEGTPLHAELADEAFDLPESATPAGSYLDAEAIAGIAAESGANAIHPGYGFLSESPVFADRCADRGIVFVGPRPDMARLMADKWEARKQMASLGVPVLPGASVDAGDEGSAKTALEAVGLPLMVKATDGGGGIGMQVVESEARLQRALRRASSSAFRAFGSAEVYIEKLVSPARHIEVQVIADQLGNVRHLWERECSAQRRHQKVIEEAPAPCLPEGLRESLAEMAVMAARETGYVGAGTFEFIVDGCGSAYFLEANTRLQVEHGVTEMITGVDLVEQQLLAAAGLPLSVDGNAAVRGYAVECRIYAEDPKTFMPSPGTLDTFDLPEIADLRIDGGYRKGDAVTPYFDPLLAKFIAWGESRDEAIQLMEKALSATEVSGVTTNIPTLQAALHHADFAAGRYSTGLIESLP